MSKDLTEVSVEEAMREMDEAAKRGERLTLRPTYVTIGPANESLGALAVRLSGRIYALAGNLGADAGQATTDRVSSPTMLRHAKQIAGAPGATDDELQQFENEFFDKFQDWWDSVGRPERLIWRRRLEVGWDNDFESSKPVLRGTMRVGVAQ